MSVNIETVGEERAMPIRRHFAEAFARSLRHNAGPLLVGAAFILAGVAAAIALDVPPATTLIGYIPVYMEMTPVAITMLLLGYAAFITAVLRPKRPLKLFIEHCRVRFFRVERIAFALPILIVVPLFGSAFTLFKSNIPTFNPYSWDPFFHRLDEALHFGFVPWELLQPIVGYPFVTWILNWFYNFWFFILCLVWVWQAFSLRNPKLRLQFFYTLLLTWIVFGIGAATLWSSVGPCFYGRVVPGVSPYAELMQYLANADKSYPIWALDSQLYLWNNYVLRDVQLASGISAMPSMHIAMSFLFMLVGWTAARWLGWVFLFYLVVMLIGSVHLGWHYAIDGYFSIVAVAIVWVVAGRLAQRHLPYRQIGDPVPSFAEMANGEYKHPRTR